MKTLLLNFLVFLPLISLSQSYLDSIPFENEKITFVEIINVPETSTETLYNKVKLIIADAYNSADAVIDIDVPNTALIVKGISNYTLKDWLGSVDQKLEHTLKIDIKEEKLRLTYTDLVVHGVNAECIVLPCKGLKYSDKLRSKHASGIIDSWNSIYTFFEKKILETDTNW